MRNFIFLIIFIPFLISCNTGNNNTEEQKAEKITEKQSTTVISDEPVVNNEVVDSVKSPKLKIHKSQKRQPIEQLISESGNTSTEAVPIGDDDEMLNERRSRTEFTNGITYYKKGELEKSAAAFKKSLEFKPDNYKAFYSLGLVYYSLGQMDLSLSYYLDAVRVNPQDSLSMMGVGLLYYKKGEMQQALDYYARTLEIAPGFSEVYFNRGTMLGQNKQYELSIEDLSNAIKYDKTNSEAYLNRGLAYFYSKDLPNACKDWQKSKEMGNEKGIQALEKYCKKKQTK